MVRNRRYQRGSLFQRGKRTKVWATRLWEDVINADGTVVRRRISEVLGTVAEIPTRRQAEQLLADRLRPINSGEFRPHSTRMFRDFGEGWLAEVLPTVKHSTRKHYTYMLRFHLYPVFGDMQLRLITRDAVQKFLMMKLQSGLSWKTCKHLRTVFGTVMGAAEVAELIPSNPVRKTRFPRRGSVKEKPVVAPEKIRELLDNARAVGIAGLAAPAHGLADR
jgi:hypothetical protein